MLDPTNLLNRVHEECCRKCVWVFGVEVVLQKVKDRLNEVFPHPISIGMRFEHFKVRILKNRQITECIKIDTYEKAFDLIGDMGSFELVKYFQIEPRGDEHGYDYVYTKELQAELANFGVWYDSDETYISIIHANSICIKNNIIMVVD